MDDVIPSRLLGRPRLDWTVAALALLTVLAPSFAAVDASLPIPAWQFFWGGLLGLGFGLARGRRRGSASISRWRRIVRGIADVLLWSIGLAILLLSIGQALPALNLALTDLLAWISWGWATVWREPAIGPPPQTLAPALWQAALARFRDTLLAAPAAGERGAALMLGVAGVTLTWSGALLIGAALAMRRATLNRGLLLLVGLGLVSILGDGGGGPLLFGFGCWLWLAIASGFRQREAAWDRAATDYSTELFRDALSWGLLLIISALLAAWILPLWPGNPLARILIRDDAIPSGLAVLERSIQRPHPSGGTSDIGIPVFAELPLGQSLEQGPPQQPALRISLSAPLPASREPRYWRARIFNMYTGNGWGSSARVADEPIVPFPDQPIEGSVIQRIEDLRPRGDILPALADPLYADIPTRAERLRDGTLLALIPIERSGSYRILSRFPARSATPPETGQAGITPADMGPYIALPSALPARVRDLATVIAGDARGAEAQALALERYLRSLPYTYQVQPLNDNEDGVDQFLFSMRSGYCTYYASAMAVMARSLGIPSRVAVGYATGEYDPATGVYLVREAEAHAWPELYIDGRWTAFEPTPIRALPQRGQAGDVTAPTSLPAEELARDRVTGPLIWLAVLAGVALLTAGGFLLGRRPPPESPVARAQRALEQCGARAGVPWPAGATLHEYTALVALRAPAVAGDLADAALLIGAAQYSGHALDQAAVARMRQVTDRLRLWKPERPHR